MLGWGLGENVEFSTPSGEGEPVMCSGMGTGAELVSCVSCVSCAGYGDGTCVAGGAGGGTITGNGLGDGGGGGDEEGVERSIANCFCPVLYSTRDKHNGCLNPEHWFATNSHETRPICYNQQA